MQKLTIAIVAALSLVAAPAYADRGYHRGYRGHHHSSGNSAWAGVAVIGALAGMAIMAERSRPVYVEPYRYYEQPVYQAPARVYAAPPVYVAAPPATVNVWYFCQSSAMYYPYTEACPEGWQTVPAGPN